MKLDPIEDLENCIDWYYELTMHKGYSDADALNTMAARVPYKVLNQLILKLQLNCSRSSKGKRNGNSSTN